MSKAIAKEQPQPPVSLEKTIVAYHKEIARFEREAPADSKEWDTLAEVSFKPHLRTLDAWSSRAATYKDAIAALTLAASEAEKYESPEMVLPMIKAVLEYLQEPRQAYLLQTPTCSRQRCPQRAKLETVK